MSSGPTTLVDNLVIAEGYLDEAFAFDDELDARERGLLTIAQHNIQVVIRSQGSKS